MDRNEYFTPDGDPTRLYDPCWNRYDTWPKNDGEVNASLSAYPDDATVLRWARELLGLAPFVPSRASGSGVIVAQGVKRVRQRTATGRRGATASLVARVLSS